MRSRLLFAALLVVAIISAGLAAVLVYRLDVGQDAARTVGATTQRWYLAGRRATALAEDAHLEWRRGAVPAAGKL